jgi:hypothetical protein
MRGGGGEEEENFNLVERLRNWSRVILVIRSGTDCKKQKSQNIEELAT